MTRARLYLLAVFVALLSFPAFGQQRIDSCAEPIEMKIAQVHATAPGRLQTEMRLGIYAKPMVERFNAQPPESEIEADQVVILTMPGAPKALILFALRGCYLEGFFIDAQWARALLGESA